MATVTPEQAGSSNVVAFLDLISFSEGADYDTIVSGVDGRETFTDFSRHPFMGRPAKEVRPGLFSSAAGRYQFIKPTWLGLANLLKLPDFSPLSQDLACIELIKQERAYDHIVQGDMVGAVQLLHETWASFPGSTAGQGGKSMNTLQAKWAELTAAVPGPPVPDAIIDGAVDKLGVD